MEALLKALIDRGYAYDVAAKMLGLDKQTQNPKYAISLGGRSINPINMLKRAGINQGIKSLMGGKLGGMLGPGLLMGGALMLGRAFDPTRQGSRNYSPNLSGQIDYLSNRDMIGRNTSSGLMQYGDNSVLRGQNVMSMFGTNNYQDQLQNKIDYFEDRKAKGKNYSEEMYEKALAEKKELFDERADIRDKAKVKSAAPTYTPPNIHSGDGGGGGGGNNNYGGATQSGGFDRGGFEQDGTGRQGYNRGGIASLWQR
jgi:hypothetical protein